MADHYFFNRKKQYLGLDSTVRSGGSPGAAILNADWRLGALNLLLDQNVPEADKSIFRGLIRAVEHVDEDLRARE
jgi:hypothetical protein